MGNSHKSSLARKKRRLRRYNQYLAIRENSVWEHLEKELLSVADFYATAPYGPLADTVVNFKPGEVLADKRNLGTLQDKALEPPLFIRVDYVYPGIFDEEE